MSTEPRQLLPRLKIDSAVTTKPRINQERQPAQIIPASTPHAFSPSFASATQPIEGERLENPQTLVWLQREMATTRWLQEERAKILQSREQWVEAWTTNNHNLIRCDTERITLAQQCIKHMREADDLRVQARNLKQENQELRTRLSKCESERVQNRQHTPRATLQERRIRIQAWKSLQRGIHTPSTAATFPDLSANVASAEQTPTSKNNVPIAVESA